MLQFDQAVYSGEGCLAAVADDLVIFGIQAVESCIDHIFKVLLQKFQQFLITAAKNRHAVCLIVLNQTKGTGMADVKGRKRIF